MKSYRLSEEARQDYFDAFDYIAQDNMTAALKWEARMIEIFDHLALWPNSGRVRPEYAPPNIRFWVVGEYVILYNPSSDPLSIVGILHGAQDLPDIISERIEEFSETDDEDGQ